MNSLSIIADRNKLKISSKNLQKAVKKALEVITKEEQKPDLSNAKLEAEYIAKLEKRRVKKMFSIEKVSTVICNNRCITIEAMKSKSRKRKLVAARQEAMFILMESKAGHTLKDVGLFFNGRDHTTVIYSVSTIHDEIATTPGYKEEIINLFKIFDPEFNLVKKGLGYLLKE